MNNTMPLIASRKAPLPLVALALGMALGFLSDILASRTGLNLGFIGWLLPLVGCLIFLMLKLDYIRFPFWIWMPWAFLVGTYFLLSQADNAGQRSVMLLTPLVVGVAFSAVECDEALLDKSKLWLERFLWLFLLDVGFATGLVSGSLADTSGFAAGTITASLLACWYVSSYVFFRKPVYLALWAIMSAVPVLAVTRTGMLAVALSLPFTFAPLSWRKRLFFLLVLVFAGALVFQMERVQRKMFFSGQGSLTDVFQGVNDLFSGTEKASGDFATSGRKAMNEALLNGTKDAFWLGHGANTTEKISMEITGVTHPHNDWLRLRYEYGVIGLLVFVATYFFQALHSLRRAGKLYGQAAIFMYAGTSAFIPMAIFMSSDNVLLYAAWFGNLQFAMLGLGYAKQ